MSTPNDDPVLPAGYIRFYDNYEPPLDAGDYTISIQQTVSSCGSGDPALQECFPAAGPKTQGFSVLAPRFVLDPADIHSVFPPNNSVGAFDENLPQIVFNKRNLPWERCLVAGNKATPWLALMLFSPDELCMQGKAAPTSAILANPTRVVTCPSSELLDPPAGTLGPQITPERADLLDQVTQLTVVCAGTGYTAAPDVIFSGGGGSGARATATIENGVVTRLTIDSGGAGYASNPQLSLSGGGGSGASATAFRGVLCQGIDVPTQVFTRLTPRFSTSPAGDELRYLAHCRQVSSSDKEDAGTKDEGWFSVVLGNRFPDAGTGPVIGLILQEQGTGYQSPPLVTLSGGGGSGATAMALLDGGVVTELVLTAAGAGYTSAPTVTLTSESGGGATAAAQIGAPWIAHLVSLEGYEAYLTEQPAWPAGTSNVRLASLYSWTFTCKSDGGNFSDLMTALLQDDAPGKPGLLLRLPRVADAAAPGTPQAMVSNAMAKGYTALRYQTLVGDNTFAWCRGPFLPAPLARIQAEVPVIASAAAAMIYDEKSGIFDQSYALAWQTGRMLALSDGTFGTKLVQWRRETNRKVNLLLQRATATGLYDQLSSSGPAADHADLVARLRTVLAPALISRTFMTNLLGDFAAGAAQRIAAGNTTRKVAAGKTRLASLPLANLRGMMANPAVRQLLVEDAAASLDAPADSPLPYLVNWLASISLLHGVPFINLLPDVRLLPQQSIRFFHVDPNYLDMLTAGALSIGIQSSRDSTLHAVLDPTIRDLVARTIPSVRALRQGAPVPPAPAPSATMAGFLLRSTAVSGWPGLEVRGYTSTDTSAPMTLGRIERLAPDVLLVLFPQAPLRVEISEPKEGLAFGFEDNKVIALRWITGPDTIGNIIDGEQVVLADQYLRSAGPAPVLRIADWQAYLEAQLSAAYTAKKQTVPPAGTWGPAAFAVQMVRAPEELVMVSESASTETETET